MNLVEDTFCYVNSLSILPMQVGCILFENSEVDLDLIRAASKCAVGEAAHV